jgi:hypothetical protein
LPRANPKSAIFTLRLMGSDNNTFSGFKSRSVTYV